MAWLTFRGLPASHYRRQVRNRPASSPVRPLVGLVFFPWFATTLSLGILVVALPLYLREAGLSFTVTTAVLAAAGVGSFVSALPAGALISRSGERATIAASVAAVSICVGLTATSERPVVLFLLQLAVGAGVSSVRLAAQTVVGRTIESGLRGRVLSGLGGTRRLSLFIGPIVGGVLVDGVGYPVTFLIAAVAAVAGFATLVRPSAATPQAPADRVSLAQALRRHWRRLFVIGAGPLAIMAARRGRTVVVPLIADSLGLSGTAVGIVVAVSTGADLLLFPLAGVLMDRFGRLFAMAPAFSLMAIGLIMMGLVDSTAGVVVAGSIIGVGNGLSSGSMLTLGTDVAPADAPGPFMAGLSAIQEAGAIVGPLLVGIIADAVGLGGASITLGVLVFVGLGLIMVTVGETRHRPAAS